MSDFMHVGWVYLPVVPSLMLGKPFSISRGSAGDSNRLKYLWNVVFFGPSRKTWRGNFLRPNKQLREISVQGWFLEDYAKNFCWMFAIFTPEIIGVNIDHPSWSTKQICDFRSLVHQIFEMKTHLNKYLIDISLYLLVNRDPYMLIVSPKITKGSYSNHQFSGASC